MLKFQMPKHYCVQTWTSWKLHFKRPKQQLTVLFWSLSCNFEQVNFINKQIFLLLCKGCRLETNNLYQTLPRCLDWVECLVDFKTKIWLQNLTWLLFDFISRKSVFLSREKAYQKYKEKISWNSHSGHFELRFDNTIMVNKNMLRLNKAALKSTIINVCSRLLC